MLLTVSGREFEWEFKVVDIEELKVVQSNAIVMLFF